MYRVPFPELVSDFVSYIDNQMYGLMSDAGHRRKTMTGIQLQTLLGHDAAMRRLHASKSTVEAVECIQAVIDNVLKPPFDNASSTCSQSRADDLRRSPHGSGHTDLTCTTCERQFSSMRRLKEHSLIHEPYTSRRHKCPECPKRFLSSSHLAYHKRTCYRRSLEC